MFAVTVTLHITPAHWDTFVPLMAQNAARSLADETGCHQFDVATDPAHPHEMFLYELYTDAAAFDVHLNTAHFKTFDTSTAHMIADKTVRTYAQVVQ
ncbi:putative quinol monooxygenase [Roseobacter sp.]|uniref:putative quinol monooxygenase n=1 Tax=Roseobacter sp. TaxID=1907202 RepID=UPI0032994035